MTNEQLAAKVRAGEAGATLQLWGAVQNFIAAEAGRYAAAFTGRTTIEDLKQSGYFAMLDAVDLYDTERGASFLKVLQFCLKKRFAEETGVRTSKRDALHYADSIDGPAFPEELDGPTVGDSLQDDSAALAFSGIEYADFLDYCRGMIGAALETLTDTQAALLRLHYLDGQSLEAAAPLCGLSCKQAASEAKRRALSHLERGKYRRELRDCLTAFDDFRNYGEAAQRNTWNRTGISRTEAAALVKMGGV